MQQIANGLEFPTQETKIKRLDELKARFLKLQAEQEVLFQEAMHLTGEEYSCGHTWDFLANSSNLSAAEMLVEMERNPSDSWPKSEEEILAYRAARG